VHNELYNVQDNDDFFLPVCCGSFPFDDAALRPRSPVMHRIVNINGPIAAIAQLYFELAI
jgi:hypothetical protein